MVDCMYRIRMFEGGTRRIRPPPRLYGIASSVVRNGDPLVYREYGCVLVFVLAATPKRQRYLGLNRPPCAYMLLCPSASLYLPRP